MLTTLRPQCGAFSMFMNVIVLLILKRSKIAVILTRSPLHWRLYTARPADVCKIFLDRAFLQGSGWRSETRSFKWCHDWVCKSSWWSMAGYIHRLTGSNLCTRESPFFTKQPGRLPACYCAQTSLTHLFGSYLRSASFCNEAPQRKILPGCFHR